QMTAWPLLFCHRMSDRLSWLKSPTEMMCQLGPGLPRLAALTRAVPFNSQITPSPVSFCHRRSGLPSPLKSPVALTCQSGPGLPRLTAAAGDDGTVCAPKECHAAVVL